MILQLGLSCWPLPRECPPPFTFESDPCSALEAQLVYGNTPASSSVATGCRFFLWLAVELSSETLAPTLPVMIGVLDSVPAAV